MDGLEAAIALGMIVAVGCLFVLVLEGLARLVERVFLQGER